MTRFASLFSGIGGFDLGFESAGMECVTQVELDPACQSVLRRHWPDATLYSDVREVHGSDLGAVDLVCGGFPCQDLSVAGRREGLAGERSGLWYEYHRLLAEAHPEWVVIENVPGLLSSGGGRDFAIVLRGLVELGYGVVWRVLDSQHFGVPQRRRRVFIVGHLGDGRAAQVLFEPEGVCGDSAPSRKAGEGVARCPANGTGSSGYRYDPNGEEYVVNCFNGYTGGADDNDAQARHIVAHTLRSEGADASEDGTGRGTPLTIAFEPRYYTRDNKTGGAPDDTVGLTNAHKAGDSAPCVAFTERTRAEGRTFESQEELAYALTNPGSGGRTHSRQIAGGFGVRRLTPRECERLQAFPTEGEIIVDALTRDEFAAVMLEAGLIRVDTAQGKVYALRGPGGIWLDEPREMGSNCNGYLVASLKYRGRQRQLRLHRVVWIAANGIPQEGMAVCHRNNDKTDNRLANLYLTTPQGNSTDAARDGLYATGEDNGRAKLRDEQVPEIVADYRTGLTLRQVAAKYGISKSRVQQIVVQSDWTRWAAGGSEISDSARYRMLGNAVTVSVAEWVGRRIVEAGRENAGR